MAHTPLLSSIIRLARQYREACKLGIPLAAVEEQGEGGRHKTSGFTRRRFLAGSLVAMAGLALPRCAFGSLSKQPKIVIVGAGIAGLNCALTLADKGLCAGLYEASSRIGGRMFSNNKGYWSEQQVTEWCGELIDSNHTTIKALASRFGLALDDLVGSQPSGAEDIFYFNGQYYSGADAVKDFQPVFDSVQDDLKAAHESTTYQSSTPTGRNLDDMSLWAWIESRVPGGHGSRLGQLLDVAFTVEYGADTTEQSALNLVYTLSGSDHSFEIFGASDERFHIKGGNQQLPESVAAHLARIGVPVKTGIRLTALREASDGRYRLSLEKGAAHTEVLADLVVLTIPFAVLRTLDYSGAGFDGLKEKAIQNLGRGKNAKLQLQFTERLWNTRGPWGRSTGTTFASCGYQNTWEPTRGQGGRSGILNDYAGGTTVDRLNTKTPFMQMSKRVLRKDATSFLQAVTPVFPGLAPLWNGKATISIPHLSPLLNYAYSYWKVGQYQSFAGYEKIRQRNVFFAGEHTSLSYQGFMEGAAQEGQRAAQEILSQLGL
jgi:monoamine oxidase